MATFVDEDPKAGLTTVRHTWRAEVFSEFGSDPEIKIHRAQAIFKTTTQELLGSRKDRVVTRNLSILPDGQRRTVLAFFELMDTLEAEDIVKEQAQVIQ